MAEYIERQKLYNNLVLLAKYETGERQQGILGCAETVRIFPAADVAEVVHGRWVPTKAPFMNECEDCSVCGYRTVWGHRYNYCPNCGAKMDGVKEREK